MHSWCDKKKKRGQGPEVEMMRNERRPALALTIKIWGKMWAHHVIMASHENVRRPSKGLCVWIIIHNGFTKRDDGVIQKIRGKNWRKKFQKIPRNHLVNTEDLGLVCWNFFWKYFKKIFSSDPSMNWTEKAGLKKSQVLIEPVKPLTHTLERTTLFQSTTLITSLRAALSFSASYA